MEFPEGVGHLSDDELSRRILEQNSRQGSKGKDGAESHGKQSKDSRGGLSRGTDHCCKQVITGNCQDVLTSFDFSLVIAFIIICLFVFVCHPRSSLVNC